MAKPKPKPKQKSSNEIDETNFRELAQKAIDRYHATGRIVDALIWSRIIGLYEKALSRRLKAL